MFERIGTGRFIDFGWTRREVVDYRHRPWFAVVITRVRNVEGIDALHSEGDAARTVQMRERPTICSRLCLEVVRAWTFDPSPGIVATIHRPTIKDGDDLLSHMLGSEGPIPDSPTDEWAAPFAPPPPEEAGS